MQMNIMRTHGYNIKESIACKLSSHSHLNVLITTISYTKLKVGIFSTLAKFNFHSYLVSISPLDFIPNKEIIDL
jgi:hypothetical protein